MFRASRSNVYLAVITLITVIMWAGFEIYRTYSTTTITDKTLESIAPLDPTVDEAVLDELAKRSSQEEEL